MKKPFFEKYGLAVLAIGVSFALQLLFGSVLAVRSNNNRVQDWLPSTFVETDELRCDQFIVITWDGCQLGDGWTSR